MRHLLFFISIGLLSGGVGGAQAEITSVGSTVRRTYVEHYRQQAFRVEDRSFSGEKTWFRLHRPVSQQGSRMAMSGRPPVILVNATHSNFQTFFVGRHSVVQILMENGYSIYGHSHRNDSLPFPRCHKTACAEAQEIDLDRTQNDIREIARLAELETGSKPVILGFSMGAIIASTLLAESPELFQGAILLDGVAYVDSPEFRADWEKNCARSERLIQKGTWTTFSEYSWVKRIGELYATDSDAKRFFTTPAMAVLALAPPPRTHSGFFNFRASRSGVTTRYTPMVDVAGMIQTSSIATSYSLVGDITCTLSRPDESLRARLTQFSRPVLGVSVQYGYGKHMSDQMALFAHPLSRHVFIPDLAHVDLIASETGQNQLSVAIRSWTERVFGPVPAQR